MTIQLPYIVAAGVPEAVLADQIKALRKRLGVNIPGAERELSMAALARILTDRLQREPPMNGSTVLRWEKQEGYPDPWSLIELAKLAGKTVEEFVYPDSATEASEPDLKAEEERPRREEIPRRQRQKYRPKADDDQQQA